MPYAASKYDTLTRYALALLRLATAFPFIQPATAKLLGVPHVARIPGSFARRIV
jgi:hypothetical protein